MLDMTKYNFPLLKLRKHFKGCYRLTLTSEKFGQVRKEKEGWIAEIRFSEDGTLQGLYGAWDTRAEAINELISTTRWEREREQETD